MLGFINEEDDCLCTCGLFQKVLFETGEDTVGAIVRRTGERALLTKMGKNFSERWRGEWQPKNLGRVAQRPRESVEQRGFPCSGFASEEHKPFPFTYGGGDIRMHLFMEGSLEQEAEIAGQAERVFT